MSEVDLRQFRERHELFDEFRRNPIGRHSPDLRLLLNALRMGQGEEPYILVNTVPHREWRLARKSAARGSPVRLVDDVTYSSPGEAEVDVLRRMWLEQTGEDPP